MSMCWCVGPPLSNETDGKCCFRYLLFVYCAFPASIREGSRDDATQTVYKVCVSMRVCVTERGGGSATTATAVAD